MSTEKNKTTLIIGASAKNDRYSNMAMKELGKAEHSTLLYNPNKNLDSIEGLPVIHDFSEITEEIDTVTIYVNPTRLTDMVQEILDLKPKRIIFNPGTEEPSIMHQFHNADIEVVEGCSIVMLKTGQF